jgi:RND family efflux transporter MFP subunit
MNASRKTIRRTVIVIAVISATLTLLFYNKSRMQAKVKNNEIQVAASVTVTKALLKLVPVTLSMVGTTYPDREVLIVSETQGKVVSVHANTGDRVVAGALIAKVDDELRRAALASAEINFEKAKSDRDRFEQLHKDSSVSDAQLEGARLAAKAAEVQYITARRQLNDTKIVAPFSGTITSRTIEVGSVLGNNTPVAGIVDISQLKIKLSIAEKDAFRLKVGDRVVVTTDIYPSAEFTGTIRNINAKGDDAHAYPIEITLPNNPKQPLRAGMFARVTFTSLGTDKAIVIPRDALVGSIRDPKVFVVENNCAMLKNVVIRADVGSTLEIISGIAEGDVVVTNGQINLKDRAAVTILQ